MKERYYLMLLCIFFTLAGCSTSNNTVETTKESPKKTYVNVEKKKESYSEEEKNMGAEERLNQLFTSIEKGKVISNVDNKTGEKLIKNRLNKESEKNWEIVKNNDASLLNDLEKQLVLERYFTKNVIEDIKEKMSDRKIQGDLINYPIELFFLDWYKSAYMDEIETKEEGILLESIPLEVVSFSGEDWSVPYIDSELEKTATLEVTNSNLVSLRMGREYNADYPDMIQKIKNKDTDNEILELLTPEGKESKVYSVSAGNKSITPSELRSIGGETRLVVRMNKEDDVWKINSVSYGY